MKSVLVIVLSPLMFAFDNLKVKKLHLAEVFKTKQNKHFKYYKCVFLKHEKASSKDFRPMGGVELTLTCGCV